MRRRQRPVGDIHLPDQQDETYNMIPIHNLHFDLDITAAIKALRNIHDLRKPHTMDWLDHMDLFDWLGGFFGFQGDNVRNQREHLVLHLANAQKRLINPPTKLDSGVVCAFRLKLFENYTSWCSYLGCPSSVCIDDQQTGQPRELLYVSLYLLIWGESANIRFLPECICYTFHHMAIELNKILEDLIDDSTGQPFQPSTCGENGFLNKVVTPIYQTMRVEVEENGRNGTAPNTEWRNYDDFNEYFWSRRCFRILKWPFDYSCNFFQTQDSRLNPKGMKTFVEQRSFFNLFRSFDRLWIMLILFLQAAIIVAWKDNDYPRKALQSKEVQVRILTVFLTWSGLRFLQSLLDATAEYSLVKRGTLLVGLRLLLKIVAAACWTFAFWVFYSRIWIQKNHDGRWSGEVDKQLINFVKIAFLFLVPDILGVVLFAFPWIENCIEKKNWMMLNMLSWWFHRRAFVGRGLRVGFVDTGKYTIFWVIVLLTKFTFSYFLQIKPMIPSTTDLLKLPYIQYERDFLFGDGARFAVGLLWLPIILIYLMDLQIWFSIYSTIIGATLGFLSHLGNIRKMNHLKLKFQFFARAVLHSLLPNKQHLKLKNVNLNKMEAEKFSILWNEIIRTFREEDIISDREVELLELPQNVWNVRVIPWPCFLLYNELLFALNQATTSLNTPDQRLWSKISKNEFRRCSVVEAYDSVKHLLLLIVKHDTEEFSFISNLFKEIDNSLLAQNFTETFTMAVLPRIHEKLITLLELLMDSQKDVRFTIVEQNKKLVGVLQDLYEVGVRYFYRVRRSTNQLREDGLAPDPLTYSDEGFLFENAIELPEANNEEFYRQVRRLHTILASRDSIHNIPTNGEARRRLTIFSNSLFMKMPNAPLVQKMLAFSVLTPYNNEEAMYSKAALRTENEDGIPILYYLQTIYPDEWQNFMERMCRQGARNEEEMWETNLTHIRLWASYRGQTLSRTVRGMMYYHRALELLAFLSDNVSSPSPPPSSSSSSSSSSILLSSGRSLLSMKYIYVLAFDEYGIKKKEKDPHAEDIMYLMMNNEALRVAYVDEVCLLRGQKEYYSVLVKYDQLLKEEVEIYRVKLPGPLKLGEGKPENQNNALIYTRGDALQTIDMNQDNYFEDALKIANLLEEFCPAGKQQPNILGVREQIFTGSVSSVAWFMSAQETSFVTLMQRVMVNPLKIRMHYGHPDVFDRFWFLTRGGICKASRMININEDIFAGFNCMLRGGSITHHEYIQVGKGRDVGLNQISMFEAKIASGNGEQARSRDVYWLGQRLDFFRMLSFFYTSVGFFFNRQIVVLSFYAFVWCQLYLVLSRVELGISDKIHNSQALLTILNQQFVVELGLLTILPMMADSSLENGFLESIWDFIKMQLQLSSVFYTFSMGTHAHYFGKTVLHGGARYQGTGRGFVVQHRSFVENYRLFARSHFVKAIELGLMLVLYASYSYFTNSTAVYLSLTISSWLLVCSWIIVPFLFNPSGFDLLKTIHDFYEFMNWIWYRGTLRAKSEESWERWWYEEQKHLTTSSLLGKVTEIVLSLRFFFFQYGISYRLDIASGRHGISVYPLSWCYLVVAFGTCMALAYAHEKFAARQHIYYRIIQTFVFVLASVGIYVLTMSRNFKFIDHFTVLLGLVPTGWGLISIAKVLRTFVQYIGVWDIVVGASRMYDLMFGMIVLTPVAVLSWIPGFQSMQTRILFNEDFSRGLQTSKIVSGKKTKF